LIAVMVWELLKPSSSISADDWSSWGWVLAETVMPLTGRLEYIARLSLTEQ